MVGTTRQLLASVVALGLSGSASGTGRVDASDFTSFWLWAGVRSQAVLERAECIYLLQGEVRRDDPVRIVSLRAAVPHVRGADVWLVVRVETLAWPETIYPQLERELARWRAAGNRVVGLQVDFDARTRHLAEYADFLRNLRRRLPAEYKLGITGLLDWSANGDPSGLAALAATVDEAVLQIYQGRHVIPGYAAYLGKLDRMTVPFRIGLLQGGEWEAPASLKQNPEFRGFVVFLVNR